LTSYKPVGFSRRTLAREVSKKVKRLFLLHVIKEFSVYGAVVLTDCKASDVGIDDA
jgi:hypothetical protein